MDFLKEVIIYISTRISTQSVEVNKLFSEIKLFIITRLFHLLHIGHIKQLSFTAYIFVVIVVCCSLLCS